MSLVGAVGLVGSVMVGAGIAALLRASLGVHQPPRGRRVRVRLQCVAVAAAGVLIVAAASLLAPQ